MCKMPRIKDVTIEGQTFRLGSLSTKQVEAIFYERQPSDDAGKWKPIDRDMIAASLRNAAADAFVNTVPAGAEDPLENIDIAYFDALAMEVVVHCKLRAKEGEAQPEA
jgi:hypothetical protein